MWAEEQGPCSSSDDGSSLKQTQGGAEYCFCPWVSSSPRKRQLRDKAFATGGQSLWSFSKAEADVI